MCGKCLLFSHPQHLLNRCFGSLVVSPHQRRFPLQFLCRSTSQPLYFEHNLVGVSPDRCDLSHSASADLLYISQSVVGLLTSDGCVIRPTGCGLGRGRRSEGWSRLFPHQPGFVLWLPGRARLARGIPRVPAALHL